MDFRDDIGAVPSVSGHVWFRANALKRVSDIGGFVQRTKQSYMKMSGKTSECARVSVYRASDFAGNLKNRLDIKRIRSFTRELMQLPDGAPLPDWSDLPIGDRIAIVAHLLPEEIRDEVMGVKSEYALPRYRNGADIPVIMVAAIAAECQLPLDWVVTGKPMERLASAVSTTPDSPRADSEDVRLQKLAFRASAGDGSLVIDDDAESVAFPRAILDRERLSPQNARLMEALGDSMRPTISDGDMLLIDTSTAATQIVEGRIYVFSIGDDAFVKRLRRIGSKVVMVSDNRETFPEVEIPNELPFRIYGRVRWAGRSL